MKKVIAVFFCFVTMVMLGACRSTAIEEVGNSVYVEISVEEIKKLPLEPDWQINPNIWGELSSAKQKLLSDELSKRNGEEFIYVNKDGDVISQKISYEMLGGEDRFYFRSSDNNLIELRKEGTSIYRYVYFLNTQEDENGRRWTGSQQRINGIEKHYYQRNNRLYYYVKEEDRYETIRLAGEIELVRGTCYNKKTGVAYPVFLRDGNLYVYAIENAVPTDEYVYKTDGRIEERLISLGEMDAPCKITGGYVEVELEEYMVNIEVTEKMPTYAEEITLSECYSKLLKSCIASDENCIEFYIYKTEK